MPERHRGGLAAGDDQAVEALEVRGRAHLARLRAEALQHLARAPRSRPGGRGRRSAPPGYQPRFWSRPPSASTSSIPMPVIGAPRSREAAAIALGVLEVGGGLDDGGGGALGVLGLEDARAHEHALGAQAHHQRGVGRGGDAAGGEQHDRAAGPSRPPRAPGRAAPAAPWRRWAARSRRARRGGGSRRRSRACGARPRPRCRCRPRPCERIIAAPSAIRRSASPRLVAPQTNGTLKAHLSMWLASSAGVRTSDSSM